MSKSVFWKPIKIILFNKYLLVVVIFFILIVFFDKHNLIDRFSNQRKMDRLQKEINYYKEEIELNKRKIEELQSSDENLEKFAREQYLMKRANEDIYLIEE